MVNNPETQQITEADESVQTQQITVVIENKNIAPTAVVDVSVNVPQTAVIEKAPQTAVAVVNVSTTTVVAPPTTAVAPNVKALQRKYFADYRAIKASKDTIITWQGKRYMNMNAELEDYSCIKINTGLDPSLFRWSSANPNEFSDNLDSDESLDS